MFHKSLQQQLANLSQRQKTAPTLPYKSTPSLLFSFQFANKIDTDTVYEIGYEGLLSLSKTQDKFIPYFKSLFSSTSKYFNREMLPKTETKSIDNHLKSLLYELSPFFLSKPSHQVLEYLIKVYKVNLYLCDDMLMSFLCYHNSTIFTKLLQNVNFNENKRWFFLENYAKNGVVIDSESVYKYFSSNYEMLSCLCSFYEENIQSDNIVYFKFICEVMKYKLNTMIHANSDYDKNVPQLIMKVVNHMNKLINNINVNQNDYIKSYYDFVYEYITKINITNEYVIALCNDIISKVLTQVDSEYHFYLILTLISELSKRFVNNNTSSSSSKSNFVLINEDNMKIFYEKTNMYETTFTSLSKASNSNAHYLAFILLTSCHSNMELFSLVKECLMILFNSKQLVKELLLLLSQYQSSIQGLWNQIEILNQQNVNKAFIELYTEHKVTSLPFKSDYGVYFNLINPNVPKVMNAINECNRNSKLMEDDNIYSALCSKFSLFDDEIILNSIISMKHLNFDKINNDVLEFYFSIRKGINYNKKVYSELFVNKIEKMLLKYNKQNEKLIIYSEIFFNTSNKIENKITYSRNVFIECLKELISISSEMKLFPKLNMKLIVNELKETLFTNILKHYDTNEINILIELIDNKYNDVLITNYQMIYKTIVNGLISSYFDNCDNKFEYLLNIAFVLFNTHSNNTNEYIDKLMNIHFSNSKQLFIAYLILCKDTLNNQIEEYVINIIKNENNNIECLLLMALLTQLNHFKNTNTFEFIFNSKIHFKYNSFSILFNNSNENTNEHGNDITKYNKALSQMIKCVYDNKSELKINKNYVQRLFESSLFNIECIYIIIIDLLLNTQTNNNSNKTGSDVIYKVLSLFTNQTTFNDNSKSKVLECIKNSFNYNQIITNILLKQFLTFYPNSSHDIILLIQNNKISNDIIDYLLSSGKFDINSILNNSLPQEFFNIVTFCVENNITPYAINANISNKKVIECIQYILNTNNDLTQNQITFFLKCLVLIERNDMSIIKQIFKLLDSSIIQENVDINICYALYALTRNINRDIFNEKDLTTLSKQLNNVFTTLLSKLDIQNVFNYEEEKKIQLIMNTSNNLSLVLSKDNDVLLYSYQIVNDNKTLGEFIKKEIINIIFNSILSFIEETNIDLVNEEFYYKYFDVILKHKALGHNDLILYKLNMCKVIKLQKMKVNAYFYNKLYYVFTHNRSEVLNKYIFDNFNKKTIHYWMVLFEQLLSLNNNNKHITITYDLISNVIAFLHKQQMQIEIKDETAIAMLNVVNLIYTNNSCSNTDNKDLIDKVITYIKSINYLSQGFMCLYQGLTLNNNNKNGDPYSRSRNFILKQFTPLLNINDNAQLYDFILEDIINTNKETKNENLIYIYQILTKLACKKVNTSLTKKSLTLIIESKLPSSLKEPFYFFSICKYLLTLFNIFPLNYIKHFNMFIPLYIKGLQQTLTLFKTDSSIKEQTLTTLQMLTNNTCEYLSPFINELVNVLIAYNDTSSNNETIKDVLSRIASKNVFDSNISAVKHNQQHMNELLLHYMNVSIMNADKLVIADMYMDIMALFIEILTSFQRYSTLVCDLCLKSFILKINEKQLKKIFEKMLLYIREKNDNKEYKITNCIICFEIFNTIIKVIKDIFITNYYTKYKNIEIELFRTSNSLIFKSNELSLSNQKLGKKKHRPIDDIDNDFNYYKLSVLLLENVKMNFMYSKGELLSETISDLIEPIIEQFKLSENKNKMLTYYDDAIKDCVCEMFKNIKSDDLFREFNEELLNLIKEENYITRYLALKMVLHLLEVIKERYLTLIGEIIPYIADTLEDSNELVQQQAVMNIKYIERVTGEKYTSYLE